MIACALCLNGWPVDECIERFEASSKIAFEKRPSARALASVLGGVPCVVPIVQFVASLVVDCKYPADNLEATLRDTYGVDRSIVDSDEAARAGALVGVTLTSTDNTSTFIVTNYNGAVSCRGDPGRCVATWSQSNADPAQDTRPFSSARAPQPFRCGKCSCTHHRTPMQSGQGGLICADVEQTPVLHRRALVGGTPLQSAPRHVASHVTNRAPPPVISRLTISRMRAPSRTVGSRSTTPRPSPSRRPPRSSLWCPTPASWCRSGPARRTMTRPRTRHSVLRGKGRSRCGSLAPSGSTATRTPRGRVC